MKISDLISQLQAVAAEHGDIDVEVDTGIEHDWPGAQIRLSVYHFSNGNVCLVTNG